MPSVKPYTTVEVCELTGLTYRQMDYYCRTGVFGDEFRYRQGRGSGRRREFSDADLAGVEAVAQAIREERRIRALIDSGEAFNVGRASYLNEHQEAHDGR